MMSKEEQKTAALVNQATRPLQQRVDRLEKEVRKLKSDLQQTKNAVNKLKR